MGKRNASTVEVVEYDEPHAFALRIVDGPLPFDGRWVLTGEDGATRVDFTGDFRAAGLKKLLRGAIARQFRKHHRNLRALFEPQRVSRPASMTNSVPVR